MVQVGGRLATETDDHGAQAGPRPQPQRARHVQQDRRIGGLVDRKVKGMVRAQIIRQIAGIDGARHGRIDQFQPVDRGGRQPRGGKFGQFRLDGQTGKGDLIQHFRRKLGHRHPPISLRQQRAFGSQPADRFTHRGHARA